MKVVCIRIKWTLFASDNRLFTDDNLHLIKDLKGGVEWAVDVSWTRQVVLNYVTVNVRSP